MDKTPFHEFLAQLFDEGKIVFRAAPRDRPSPLLPSRSWPRRSRVAASPSPVPASPSTPKSPSRRPSWFGKRAGRLVNRDEPHDRPGQTLENAGLAADAVAASFSRSDPALLATGPAAGARARPIRPARRAARKRPARLAALGNPLRCRGRAALSPCNSAGTQGSCSCMPNV